MIIYFIRHGATAGNLEKRYIGRTDEELCTEGIERLKELRELVPDIKGNSIPSVCQGAEAVFTSPMKRCIATADILFPDKKKIIIDDFRECDFGDFEGYNYQELNGNADYQRWIDSDGGTIMSILEKYEKHHEYYRWQCGNGSGYAAVYKDGVLDVTDRIGF